jgi:hypothetical protein
MKINRAIRLRCALPVPGIQKQMPAARRAQHIFGNVKRSKARRPKVSIVQTAAQAKAKLINPQLQDAKSALVTLAPAFTDTVEEWNAMILANLPGQCLPKHELEGLTYCRTFAGQS